MTDCPSLSLERVELVNIQSAALTLRTDGYPVEISWYSINGGPPQGRAFPVVVNSDRPVMMFVTLVGQGRGFQPGRNELTLGTIDGYEYSFELSLRRLVDWKPHANA
jgi:hypothetical protein